MEKCSRCEEECSIINELNNLCENCEKERDYDYAIQQYDQDRNDEEDKKQ